MKKKYIGLLFLVFQFAAAFSQVDIVYSPEGKALENTRLEKWAFVSKTIHRLELNDDQKSIREEKSKSNPDFFGICINTNFDLSDGDWYETENGKVWAMDISCEDAKSLELELKDYYLPDGSELYVVNHDKTLLYGPIKESGKCHLTEILSGSQVSIYLYVPTNILDKPRLTVDRVICSDQDWGVGASSPCNIDVAAYPEYLNSARAVCRIAMVDASSAEYHFSGSLVMSTGFKPYLLTAFHSIDVDNDYAISNAEKSYMNNMTIRIHFRYKQAGGVGGETISYPYSGATFKAGWCLTDFVLAELCSDITDNTEINWLGWNRSGSTPTSVACLHHPSYDVMKIYTGSDISTGSYNGFNYYWNVEYDDGIAENGSSGGPLLDQNQRVVGQHRASSHPSSPCSGTDAYCGKFSDSWTGGTTNTTRLSNWLDSIGTGVTVMPSLYEIKISGADAVCTSNVYSIPLLPSGYTILWSLSGDDATNFTLQSNTPSTNLCTITRINNTECQNNCDLVLTAQIKFGATLLHTCQKSLDATNINGPTVLCSSHTYQVNNLPSGCTVSWSWSGTGVIIDNTPIIIEPYYSTNNYFSLSRSSINDYAKGTITANIQQNGNTIATITKTIDTGANFSGTWYQGTATATTLQCGQAYSISYGSQVVLQSSDFVGKTVTYTKNGLRLWGNTISHSGNTISFTPLTPVLNPNEIESGGNLILPNSITIKVAGSGTCECYEFTFSVPSVIPPLNNPSLNVGASGSEYTFSLKTDADDANGASGRLDQTWKLEIVQYETGQTICKMESDSPKTVNTSGWKPGIYIAVATIGENSLAQKLVIN